MPHRTVDYRELFDSIDEGFCIIEVMVDRDGRPVDYRFLEANSAFEEQTGLIDAVGKSMRELAPGHEDHWFAIYGGVAATGEPARFENRAEQLHRWYDVYAFRIGDPDERHVAVLFRDITARKANEEAARTIADELRASERRLRAVFENAATGILQTDQQDRFVAVNDRVCQMLGYRRCRSAS